MYVGEKEESVSTFCISLLRALSQHPLEFIPMLSLWSAIKIMSLTCHSPSLFLHKHLLVEINALESTTIALIFP